jgi:hypothetical protein
MPILRAIRNMRRGGSQPARGIFVQGCARSGNTLVRELCAAGFANAEALPLPQNRTECSFEFMLATLARTRPPSRILVASRNREASLAMDRELLRAHPEVQVVWMLRHPFDVLTSFHRSTPGRFYVSPERLIASLDLHESFRHEAQVLTLRYEDVILHPQEAQNEIAAAFALEPSRSFTECHAHFTAGRKSVVALHSIRPLDADGVGRWRRNPEHRQYLRGVLAAYPGLTSLSRRAGYELQADIERAESSAYGSGG